MASIEDLYQKFLDKRCSREEAEALLRYFREQPDSGEILALIQAELDRQDEVPDSSDTPDDLAAIDRNQEALRRRIFDKPPRRIHPSTWALVAASAVVFLSLVFYLFVTYTSNETKLTSQYGSDVLPGSNRATLLLADGTRIELDSTSNGIRVNDKTIAYNNGAIVAENKAISTAELQVPNGGIYRLTLSDGTKVVLNSGSSLSYPIHFSDSVRLVHLQGEGYFEVTPDKSKPFKVKSGGQTLTVLGTHFNIQSYAGELIQTTLLEGKVSLRLDGASAFLAPGQQATMQNNKYQVKKVNAKEAIAWANNLFVFNHIPLNKIFKSLERWYDVDINFPSTLTNETYLMEIPKDRKLSEILSSISDLTGIEFKIEGRRVTATMK